MSAGMPELRTPVMIRVEASWEDLAGALHTTRARMEDKSAGGACIRMKTPIELGSTLRIQWRFDQFSGVVKYCRSEGREYLVGIQRDSANTPVPDRPVPSNVPPRQDERSIHPPLSAAKIESLRQRPTPFELPEGDHKAESLPMARLATNAASAPPRGSSYIAVDHNRPGLSQPQHFNAAPQTELHSEPPPKRKEAGKERKFMGRKWLGLTPWHDKQDDLGANGDENSNGTSDKENSMTRPTQSMEKAPPHSAREVPTFQVELLPMEDIYQAAGIVTPRKGYGVNKVVEMLNSDHMRGLSKEMRRAAVLMALDAAGISLEKIQSDAKAREDALDSYETDQRKQAEAEWARRAEEVVQVQAELESIKAHYMARISRTLESVSKDKVRFSTWVATKQQETQSMSEAVDLCLKSPVSEPASHPETRPLPELSRAAATSASQESRSEGIH
jgi:hypothetical protein